MEENSHGYTIYVKVWEICEKLTLHFQSTVMYMKDWLEFCLPAELKLSYLKKPYQITMQTFQMAILLLFEKTDSLTCREVQESLQLNSEQFSKHLASLIESKILLADTEVNDPLSLYTPICHRSLLVNPSLLWIDQLLVTVIFCFKKICNKKSNIMYQCLGCKLSFRSKNVM
jgi:hypothetical protein